VFRKERRFRDALARVYGQALAGLEARDESPETKALLGSAMAGGHRALGCFGRVARKTLGGDSRLNEFRHAVIEETDDSRVGAAFRVATFANVRRASGYPWSGPWADVLARAPVILDARPGPEQRMLELTPPSMSPDLDPAFVQFQIATVSAVIEAATGQAVEVGTDELAVEWSDCFTNGLQAASEFLESEGPRLGADMEALRP
jgi:hypothetical protein